MNAFCVFLKEEEEKRLFNSPVAASLIVDFGKNGRHFVDPVLFGLMGHAKL